MEKNLLLIFVFLLLTLSVNAEKVSVKAGTIVPLESIKQVKASQTHEGEFVDFMVIRDVKVGDIVAIPAGTIAKGKVYEAKRSTAFGTKGRLGIKISNIILPSGDVIYFTSSDVYIQGKNRTPLSIIVFLFTCLPFPCGSKAVMPVGYECEAIVAGNVDVNIQ